MALRLRRNPSAVGDPFAPIEAAVTAALALLGVSLAFGLLILAVQGATSDGDSWSVNLFGYDDPACVTVDAGRIGVAGNEPDPLTGRRVPETSARGSTMTDAYRVCLDRPSFGEQTAASADSLLSLTVLLGSALLVRSVIRRARRDGLFGRATAGATRRLGWFLVLMSVAEPVGVRIGNGIVVAAAVAGQRWWDQLQGSLPASFTLLLVGLGVLSFARILRLAVPLQEEAALTV